jgi:micrococcal nuclease
MASRGQLEKGQRAFTLAAVCLVLAGCGQGGLERLAPGETGRVAEVRSGDSFVLDNGLQVRLAGVEAPWGDQPFADQARSALAELILHRQVQLLYGGARRNRYGRALAQVKLARGGRWVQGLLLRQGDVRERTWADNRAMARAMLEDEAHARNRGLGLWALKDYRVLLPGETEVASGFQIVEGRVLGQEPADGGGVALDFQRGQGERFTAGIETRSLGDFKTADKAPDMLVGKLARLRGPIRYGPDGPVMRLDHPEQVEILKGG